MNQIPRGGQPSPGDVLITVKLSVYFVSVVPHPPRLRFKEWADALAIAMDWANANHCRVWRLKDDEMSLVQDRNPPPVVRTRGASGKYVH